MLVVNVRKVDWLAVVSGRPTSRREFVETRRNVRWVWMNVPLSPQLGPMRLVQYQRLQHHRCLGSAPPMDVSHGFLPLVPQMLTSIAYVCVTTLDSE